MTLFPLLILITQESFPVSLPPTTPFLFSRYRRINPHKMSSHNFKYTRVGEPRSITNQQPKPSSEIYPMDSPNYNEKFCSTSTRSDCECESQRPNGTSGHGSCHNSRLRRLLIPALIAFIVLGGLMTLGCTMGGYNPGSWGSDLVSRALGDSTTGSGNGTNGGTFVHNKRVYSLCLFFLRLVFEFEV